MIFHLCFFFNIRNNFIAQKATPARCLARIALQFLLMYHYASGNFTAQHKGNASALPCKNCFAILVDVPLRFGQFHSTAQKATPARCLARIALQFLLMYHYASGNFTAQHKTGVSQSSRLFLSFILHTLFFSAGTTRCPSSLVRRTGAYANRAKCKLAILCQTV